MAQSDAVKVSPEAVFNRILHILDSLSRDWEHSQKITPQTHLIRDLGFESIDLVVLGTTIEKSYNRHMPFAQFFAEVGQRKVPDIRLDEMVDLVVRSLEDS